MTFLIFQPHSNIARLLAIGYNRYSKTNFRIGVFELEPIIRGSTSILLFSLSRHFHGLRLINVPQSPSKSLTMDSHYCSEENLAKIPLNSVVRIAGQKKSKIFFDVHKCIKHAKYFAQVFIDAILLAVNSRNSFSFLFCRQAPTTTCKTFWGLTIPVHVIKHACQEHPVVKNCRKINSNP